MAYCPDCDKPIEKWKEAHLDQVFECPDCGAYLEVISLTPFEVDYYIGDDDWNEEEED